MVSRPRLSAAATLLVGSTLAFSVAAAPVSAATKTKPTTGTISGTVAGSMPTANGDASVRFASATSGAVVAVKRPGTRGAFKATLDPGSYAVTATVVSASGTLSRQTVAVSVKAGQKRAGVRLRPSKVNVRAARAAARAGISAAAASLSAHASSPSAASASSSSTTGSAVATRSYVTERGNDIGGTTAFSILPFHTGSGSWKSLTAGLSSVLMAGAQGRPICDATLTENSTVLPFIRREAKGGQSAYFSSGKLKRDLIEPDVTVSGSVTPAAGGRSATLTLDFRDAKTKAFATIKSTITKARWANAADQLAKVVGERVCRAPGSYEVALHVDGLFDFPTHSATGVIDSSLRARARGEGVTWAGSGTYLWTKVVYTSKTGCTFQNIQPTSGGWAASIAATQSHAQITVNWALTATDQTKLTIATAYCPNIPAIPKFPGPSQINLTPTSFTFPAEGGVGKVGGGISVADLPYPELAPLGPLGFTNTGTLTVTPVWRYQAP